MPLHEVLTAGLLVNMLFAFGLSRLGFLVGVGITVPYVLAFAALVASDQLPGIGLFQVFLLLVGLVVSSIAGYLLEAGTRSRFWQRRIIAAQSKALAAEKEKSERLLENMLPGSIVARLRDQPASVADSHPAVSVLFADLVGFTPLAGRLSPAETVDILNELFSRFDELAGRHGLEKIKTMGDAYMAVAGARSRCLGTPTGLPRWASRCSEPWRHSPRRAASSLDCVSGFTADQWSGA